MQEPENHTDEHGNHHRHPVPAKGQFRLQSCCDGCGRLAGD